MEKGKRNRALTTQRIVDALEHVLVERGLAEVSIHHIAETAAVSKALIYRYFGGLDGLFNYYLRMGRLVPHHPAALVELIQPEQAADLAVLWSEQALQLARRFRTSPAGREILRATIRENDSLAATISQAQDDELTRMVHQLAFVKEADYRASSAVVLGALSYLTILAQTNRPMIGIDLGSEAGWQRIEDAVRVICKAMGYLVTDSPRAWLVTKPGGLARSTWLSDRTNEQR